MAQHWLHSAFVAILPIWEAAVLSRFQPVFTRCFLITVIVVPWARAIPNAGLLVLQPLRMLSKRKGKIL